MDSLSTVSTRVTLLEDFSLKMTGKDVHNLEKTRGLIPSGTRINVTFLGNEKACPADETPINTLLDDSPGAGRPTSTWHVC
ncbi:hypothetical protein [Streptomyces sp. NPDC002763]|uniref:hypothetical protein n=1 Tax=Streptomyces sp. NPDC002763 TaxID=3154427 RepID=UPI003320C536